MRHSSFQNSAAGFYIRADNPADMQTGVAALSWGTGTIQLSKSGGAFVNVSPTVSDLGGGIYWITPNAAHRDTLGEICWRFIQPSAVIAERIEKVVLVNDQAARFGASDGTGVTLAANQDVRNILGTLPNVTLAASQPNYAPARAGDEMTLTSTVLTALFADADVAALVNDIAARFDAVDDLPIATIAAACRDAILNRLLSLHTAAGSVGEALGLIAGRATPAQAQAAATAALDAISQTALARFVTVDTGQTTAANGSVAKLAQGAGGGGGGGLTTEQDEKLTEIHEAIYPDPPSSPPLVVIPSPLGSTTGWLVCRDANTSLPKSGVTVFWSLAQAPPGHYGSLLSTSEQSAISASDGVVQLPGLLPGSVYYIRSGNRPATTANIPPTAGPSTELPSMLG